jgi:hypothetical protein
LAGREVVASLSPGASGGAVSSRGSELVASGVELMVVVASSAVGDVEAVAIPDADGIDVAAAGKVAGATLSF